jgi:hypothetical protein
MSNPVMGGGGGAPAARPAQPQPMGTGGQVGVRGQPMAPGGQPVNIAPQQFGGGPTGPAPTNFGAPMSRNMEIAGRQQNIPRQFIYGPGQQGPFGA